LRIIATSVARSLYHPLIQTIVLKRESQRELHLARGPCASRGSKGGAGIPPRDHGSVRIDCVELRVIEGVINFPPERKHALFAADIAIPEQGRIEIASSRSAYCVLRRISNVAPARNGNTGRIEEPGGGLIEVCEVGIAG